jgi:four helix bundle protein
MPAYMTFLFENLDVYQRAVNLAERITGLTKSFPAQGHYHLVDQLRRASLSISLNIAEGNGRWHVKDRKNFWWIARGSVFECVPLLELCKREKLITEEMWADLKSELEVLSKMLTALIKGTDKRGS